MLQPLTRSTVALTNNMCSRRRYLAVAVQRGVLHAARQEGVGEAVRVAHAAAAGPARGHEHAGQVPRHAAKGDTSYRRS